MAQHEHEHELEIAFLWLCPWGDMFGTRFARVVVCDVVCVDVFNVC